MRRLMEWYACSGPRSVRSCLSDARGDAGGSCLLTIAAIIGRTPPAYRINGRSVLDAWCEAYRRETEILTELAQQRQMQRGTRSEHLAKACGERIVQLAKAADLAGEQVIGYERDSKYEGALDWAAYWLETSLSHVAVSDAELSVWRRRLVAVV